MASRLSMMLRSEMVQLTGVRAASTHTHQKDVKYHPVVVLGGGSGGCSMAARLCRMLGQGNVAVVEPSRVGVLIKLNIL